MNRFKRKLIFGIIYFGIGIALILWGTFLWNTLPYWSFDRLWILLLWGLGGILFIAAVGLCLRSASLRKKMHRLKEIGQDSKKIVDYLKTDNSGITQLKLASVLQIDDTKMKKCLNHLEWLGVVEKKKVSAEETVFFYKKDHEEDN